MKRVAYIFLLCFSAAGSLQASDLLELNTCNEYKLDEYVHLFEKYDCQVQATQIDLHEIQSDPISVVVHKASQMGEGVLVDDTSLEVDGADIGVNVRWLSHTLSSCIGKRATWRVLLAQRQGDKVYVYEGHVDGTIVNPRVYGYSFDSYLLPDGTDKTLAEERPEWLSARARAVEALVRGEPCAVEPVIEHWDGPWQEESIALSAH